MNIQPLHDRVVLKRLEAESVSPGGIHIPDVAAEKPEQGEVLAVGPGKHNEVGLVPMAVSVGDKVLFGKYSGQTVKLDGAEVLVMREEDIIGILR